MAATIFSACSTTPSELPTRNKPVSALQPIPPYEEAATVAEIPGVYVRNMEKAGLCRVRLHTLQEWVESNY